jgi:hypothetical protein
VKRRLRDGEEGHAKKGMQMFVFATIALSVATISLTITRARVFHRLREKVGGPFECPYCCVHWVGALLTLWVLWPSLTALTWVLWTGASIALATLCMGAMARCLSWIEEEETIDTL